MKRYFFIQGRGHHHKHLLLHGIGTDEAKNIVLNEFILKTIKILTKHTF